MSPRTLRFWSCCLAALALCLTTQRADAAFTTQLNRTNEGNVNDAVGGAYATVTITALSSTQFRFTVTPIDSSWGSGNTVVVREFGFNFNSSVTGALSIGTLPTGWETFTPNLDGNLDGFGTFEYRIRGGAQQYDQDPLVFTINTASSVGTSDANIQSAFFEGNSQGRHYAAHMRGFNYGGTTSAFFSDGPPVASVPAPAGFVLLASALPVLGLRRLIRRKTTVAA